MDKKQLESSILEIIKEVSMEDDVSDLKFDESFKDQLDIDSMDFLDIVMKVKEKYSITVPSDDFPHFRTMNQLVQYLQIRLKSKAA